MTRTLIRTTQSGTAGAGGREGRCSNVAALLLWCVFTYPQAVIVVGLLAELLGAQDVQLAHLSRQRLGVREALGEQHDLRDQRVVRHHHGHRAEADLF